MNKNRILASALALALGLGVMTIDANPGWDDTGITVGLLFLGAGIGTVAGAPWWLASALVALPVVVAELSGGTEVLVAFPITLAGALVGWLARRAVRGR